MPVVHGCYFSKREIKKDREFLEKQRLSEEQIVAIDAYWRKRLCRSSLFAALYGIAVFYVASLVFLIF